MSLYKMTANELVTLIKKREVSSVDITKSVLERIDDTEKYVDGYLCVLHEEAMKKAEEVDKKIAAGEEVSPLAGIPAGIKDNICTEGITTTCASKMLYNFVPPYNATVMDKLSDAVVLGKTNMDEFAMGSSTETSHFKLTKNPHDLKRVPGGSSGGSAAVVASDEAVFSLGSDTGGSIRQPAAFCGVVGFKPTYGLVSRYGLVPFASSLDQIGPITKDVTDCALVLNAITGHDEKDATSLPHGYEDYMKALNPDVKGLKVGIPKEYVGEAIDSEIRQAVMEAAAAYEKLGAHVGECSLPMMPYALAAYYLISSAEASSNLARYDGIRFGFRAENNETLDDIYLNSRSEAFGWEVKRRIVLGTFILSAGYYDAYYKKAQQVRTLIKQDFDRVLGEYDVLLAPTTPITAWEFNKKSDDPLSMYAADVCTVSVNIAGLPGMSLPFGTDSNGLPIGIQLIGRPLGESTLIRTGYALEQSPYYKKVKPSIGGSEV